MQYLISKDGEPIAWIIQAPQLPHLSILRCVFPFTELSLHLNQTAKEFDKLKNFLFLWSSCDVRICEVSAFSTFWWVSYATTCRWIDAGLKLLRVVYEKEKSDCVICLENTEILDVLRKHHFALGATGVAPDCPVRLSMHAWQLAASKNNLACTAARRKTADTIKNKSVAFLADAIIWNLGINNENYLILISRKI